MTVSERLRSCWGLSRLTHHGDLRSSRWNKPQELHRLPFGLKNKSLQPRFTALSFRSIFMSWWVRLSFIHKTLDLNSFFFFFSYEISCVFLWATIGPNFTETKKLQAKVLNSKCRAILVCKLLQNMNFDGLTFLTDHQIIWTILTGILIGLL